MPNTSPPVDERHWEFQDQRLRGLKRTESIRVKPPRNETAPGDWNDVAFLVAPLEPSWIGGQDGTRAQHCWRTAPLLRRAPSRHASGWTSDAPRHRAGGLDSV
ncbi:MAG: hypothetical protein L0Z50_04310 [Verrucomicrobiales bacterium]|nr:hypothetical protein [Verrucomicrobiales bacterium]